MKVKRIIAPITTLLLLAGTGFVSYQAGKDSSEAEISVLQSRVDSLRKGEIDAAVTRSVSKQMEEIAYQQKDISDEQRVYAEKQSLLAIRMRDNAEQQSKAARKAEAQALESAQEAKKQRLYAQTLQMVAESQRDQAREAKLMSDTLNYRAIGRSLGMTFLSINDKVDKQVPSLLAYSSWMFLDRYKGNTYYPETFKALEQQSGLCSTIHLTTRSAVNAMAALPSGDGCVAVSGYGDIVSWQNGHKSVIFHDKQYDFHAVQLDNFKKHIYAVSIHGPLVSVNSHGTSSHVVNLPADKYIDMIDFDKQRMVVIGKKGLVWFYKHEESVGERIELPHTLSCACKRDNKVCLFYTDGSYGELDANGNLTGKNAYTKRVITAADYNEKYGLLMLGSADGYIAMFNRYDRLMAEFSSHNASITHVKVIGDILISTGYDRIMCVWNTFHFQLPSGCSFAEEMNSPIPLHKEVSSGLGTEWVSSVNYEYSSWPLALCGSSKTDFLWLGTGDGEMVSMNINASEMASLILNNLKRNFTKEEWQHYVGVNVPYEKFK